MIEDWVGTARCAVRAAQSGAICVFGPTSNKGQGDENPPTALTSVL